MSLYQLVLLSLLPQLLLVLSWPPFGRRPYLLGGFTMYIKARRRLSFPPLPCSNLIPSPDNIACVMGYIVDLTIVMRKLSDIALDISKQNIESALKEFTEGDITRVHQDIRKFLTPTSTVSLANKDIVLGEIIDLIHMYCNGSK